jgi:hypothetical protein
MITLSEPSLLPVLGVLVAVVVLMTVREWWRW